MTAYTFYIDSMGIILWQMETYFVNEKQEILTIYPASCWARAKAGKYLQFVQYFQQFYTHVRLYYRCLKVWMVKIWQIYGQLLISPNFYGAKVSLHLVAPVNMCTCEFNLMIEYLAM